METKPKTVAMGGAKIEIQLHEWRYSSGRFLLMAACDGFADQLRVFAAPVRISARLGEIPAGTVPRVTTKSKIDATDGAKIETWLHRWRYGPGRLPFIAVRDGFTPQTRVSARPGRMPGGTSPLAATKLQIGAMGGVKIQIRLHEWRYDPGR